MDPTPLGVWQPRPKFQDRVWLHVLLFALTDRHDDARRRRPLRSASSTISARVRRRCRAGVAAAARPLVQRRRSSRILGCHELGTTSRAAIMTSMRRCRFSFRCRSLLTGTLGAFIRIREPIPEQARCCSTSASPVRSPASSSRCRRCSSGMAMSHVVRVPAATRRRARARRAAALQARVVAVLRARIADGYSLNLHPMAFAAWFGMLATALNLFPIGQLDGGHISYAVLGRAGRPTSRSRWSASRVVPRRSSRRSWIVWTRADGRDAVRLRPRHPRVFDEDVPLDRTRAAAGASFARRDVRPLLHAGADRSPTAS